MSWTVLIIEYAHMGDDDARPWTVGPFPTFELACEYARRWTRDSIEELRKDSVDETREQFLAFGEKATVIAGDDGRSYSPDIEAFLASPASDEERDWHSIQRAAGIADD